MVQSLALNVFTPRQLSYSASRASILMHTSPYRCCLASGASPWQGRQPPLGQCALGPPPPSRSPPRCCNLPSMRISQPPFRDPACSCPGWCSATMPQQWTSNPSNFPAGPACVAFSGWQSGSGIASSKLSFGGGASRLLQLLKQQPSFHRIHYASASADTFAHPSPLA